MATSPTWSPLHNTTLNSFVLKVAAVERFDCIHLLYLVEYIIWLAPQAGKMNQILICDWLPEQARWSCLACSELPAVFRKKNFSKSHIVNSFLTKFVRSRWLDIGPVSFSFCKFKDHDSIAVHKNPKKNLAKIQLSNDLSLGQ